MPREDEEDASIKVDLGGVLSFATGADRVPH